VALGADCEERTNIGSSNRRTKYRFVSSTFNRDTRAFCLDEKRQNSIHRLSYSATATLKTLAPSTILICACLALSASEIRCQAEENREPTWEETTGFVTRTLEHYGKYFIFGHPDDGNISNVTIAPKTLSYQFSIHDWDLKAVKVNGEWTHVISFPLDKLDISSFKVSKLETKWGDQSIFSLQFYCLEGKCVQDTVLQRTLGNDGQWGNQEQKGIGDSDNWVVTSADEDAINRLARALKHLAILAGSPSKELFGH
jgi:hypothetical protein